MKMKQNRKRSRIFAGILACSLCFSTPFSFDSHAENLKEKQQELEGNLSKMEHDKDALSRKISSITDSLNSIVNDIKKTRMDLDLAKAREVGQYEMMKKRIQYMYESSSGNFFTSLLESESMTELLNRAEFFNTVSQYDRKMLEKLQKIHADIEEKEQALLSKQTEMESTQQELNTSFQELTSMIRSTSDEIDKYKEAIREAEEAEKAAEEAKKENEDSLNSSKPSKPSDNKEPSKDEKPQDDEKPQNNEKPSSPDKPAEDHKPSTNPKPQKPADNTELALFAAILECEAGSTNYDGLLAVATVIMNRKESPKYPNTISGVIYQKGQFSPSWTGKLDKVLARGPKPLCFTVAKDALNGKRLAAVKNCYQFRASWTGHAGTVIGGNVFF